MHKVVFGGRVSALVLERAEPDVALPADVAFEGARNEDPDSNIKFSIFDEHRFFQVFLN